MNESSNTLITIPLSRYLELLLRHKSTTVVDREEGMLLKSIDLTSRFVHVEFVDDNDDHPSPESRPQHCPASVSTSLAIVWHIKDWNTSLQKWKLLRVESDKRNEQNFRRKELMSKLETVIKQKLGQNTPPEIVANMADMIYQTNNLALAHSLGLEESITELCQLGEQIPQSC